MPEIQNLLFAYDPMEALDLIIAKNKSLQYQYRRGQGRGTPMTVPDWDMERFIRAVDNDPSPIYYTVYELSSEMLGRKIRVID